MNPEDEVERLNAERVDLTLELSKIRAENLSLIGWLTQALDALEPFERAGYVFGTCSRLRALMEQLPEPTDAP